MPLRFATVVLDVDSTLSAIEGIDWLATLRGGEIAEQVSRMTAEAMAGHRLLNDVYGARLDLVRPTKAEVEALADAYARNGAPGAGEAIARMRDAGAHVHAVTSGVHAAVAPFVESLGIAYDALHAVRLNFDEDGRYESFDPTSPLVVQGGKRIVVESLACSRPVLAVGDGITDAEIRPAADAFAAYTGFVRRDAVAAVADFVVSSFAGVAELVLAEEKKS